MTAPTTPDRATDGTLLSDDDFLLLINAWWEPLGFRLPTTRPDQTWHVEIDTYDPPAAALSSETSPGDAITVAQVNRGIAWRGTAYCATA